MPGDPSDPGLCSTGIFQGMNLEVTAPMMLNGKKKRSEPSVLMSVEQQEKK